MEKIDPENTIREVIDIPEKSYSRSSSESHVPASRGRKFHGASVTVIKIDLTVAQNIFRGAKIFISAIDRFRSTDPAFHCNGAPSLQLHPHMR